MGIREKFNIFKIIRNMFKRKQLTLNGIKQNRNIFKQFNKESEDVKEIEKIYNELCEENNDLYDTLDAKILQKRYREGLGIDKIEILSRHSNMQKDILELDDKSFNFFVKCLKHIEKEQFDWMPLIGRLIINAKYFSKESTENEFDKMNERDKTKFLALGLLKSDLFEEISSVSTEGLQNYDERKKEVAIGIIREPEKKHPQDEYCYYFKDLEPINKVKYAILSLKYEMTFEQAQELFRKYGGDIDVYEGTKEGIVLKGIESILKEKDINKLQDGNFNNIETDYKTLINLESSLRNTLIDKFNEKLYKPSQADFVRTERVKIRDENGKNKIVDVPIYNAIGNKSKEIYMITHSRGGILGYIDEDAKKSYKQDWIRPNLKNSIISSCCVGNEFWGYVDGIMTYGFSSFKANTLHYMAPHDAASGNNSFEKNYNDYGSSFGPKGLINNAEAKYCETVWDRLELENGRYKKKELDYVLDIKKPLLPKEKQDMKDPRKFKVLKKWEKEWWNNKKIAAAEHGIPIVIVDVEKSIELESKAVKEMVQEFEMTCGRNSKLLENIITKFENNRAYLVMSELMKGDYKELIEKYFSKDSSKDCLKRIMNVIEQTNPEYREQCLDTLTNVTLLERKRWMKNSNIKLNEEEYEAINIDGIQSHENYEDYLTNRLLDYDEFLKKVEDLKQRETERKNQEIDKDEFAVDKKSNESVFDINDYCDGK